MNLKKALLFSFIITFFAPVFAIPKGPHVFSGYVFINGVPAPDGTLIEVKVSGLVVARTFTQDGSYNYSENGSVFYVPDPDGTMPGKVLKFYVRGIYSAQYVFESFAITKLNLNVTTVCGNLVCEPGETSSNCCTDCGCSSGYSCVSNACTINTPTPYCGDGACNGAEDCSNCATDCGTCPPTGGGGNTYVPPEEEEETEPYCGDGTCDNNETCATCTQDCGKCPPECLQDTDCDDGDECTKDTCNESCSYEIICEKKTCTDECVTGQVKCENSAVYTCASDGECLKWTKNNDCANGCCNSECCTAVDFNEEESGSNGLGLGSGGNPGLLNTISGFASNLVEKPFIPVIIIGGIGAVLLTIILKKGKIRKYY